MVNMASRKYGDMDIQMTRPNLDIDSHSLDCGFWLDFSFSFALCSFVRVAIM